MRRRLEIMNRENVTQLVLQNALLIFELRNAPLRELEMSWWADISLRLPFFIWGCKLFLQVLSIILSAKSTVSGIVDYVKFRAHVRNRRPTLHFDYFLITFRCLLYILLNTLVVYLVSSLH